MKQISFILLLIVFCINSFGQEKKNKPNIVLIVVDDLGYADMSHTGLADDVSTPNIDKLAHTGVRFTNAYATSSICSPSRAGIITGCYQQRWGTIWYGGPGLHKEEFKTIPELLSPLGYKTGYVGKVHYGKHDSDTSHRSFPLNHGFDYFFGHTSHRKHYLNHQTKIEKDFQLSRKENERKGQSMEQGSLWLNYDKVDTIGFATEMFGEAACKFIQKHSNEPFFLQIAFNAVHNFTHQLPEEYLKNHNLKGYHDWDPAKEEYFDWYFQGRYPLNPEGREHYLGQLYYLDKEIGRVMDFLEENELRENTLVIFISDNGGSTPIYANNTPLRGSKYTIYEGGIRVPLIISYPEAYQSGTVSNNLVSAMDILPTICKETGAVTPDNINGIDISAVLTGKDDTVEHSVLYWLHRKDKAIRRKNMKYIWIADNWKTVEGDFGVDKGEQLYDLNTDNGESTNISSENKRILNNLNSELDKWVSDIKKARKTSITH